MIKIILLCATVVLIAIFGLSLIGTNKIHKMWSKILNGNNRDDI